MAERRSVAAFVAPVLIVLAVAGAAVWWITSGDGGEQPEPVRVSADGPRFGDVEEMAAASDLVVIGTVSDLDDGRTITDPSDPAAGLRTQLAAVDVSDVLVGDLSGPLVVEQEAELLDGTPMIVNGVGALREGDEGVMFLVRGDTEEFPYTAFVNEQGWAPIVDGVITPLDASDPVWAPLNDASPSTLAATILSQTD